MDNFPHQTLTAIHGKPTPQALQRLKKELYANAMSVPSTRGGGQHGHLSLVMAPIDYELLDGAINFDPPIHPGQAPTHGPNATTAQIHAADTTYSRNITEYNTYISTRNALRTLLLAAVQEDFYNLLNDARFGYALVTPLAILEHLDLHYGNITPKDLEQNREALRAPWNPDDDIATLWTRVKECQDFARNTTEPISAGTAMLLLLDALTTSGVMNQYISEWKRKDSVDQTYHNFCAHFDRANKVRIEETTAKQAGYHSANSVDVPVSTTGAANHSTIGVPSPSPAPLNTSVRVDNLATMFFCWTHGLGRNPRHTSKTCKKPAHNHQRDATILDMRGGCKLIQTRRDPLPETAPTPPE
jgi:hypothetical protein